MKSVCCRARQHEPLNSYAESFRHPIIKKLRSDLISGIKNPICQVCWSDEDLGMTSTRQLSIENKTLEQLETEVDRPTLKWLWIDPGNSCNFACRVCYPHWSTTLGVEYKHKWKKPDFLEIRRPDLSVIKNEDLSSINTIMILGGEPFLNLEHLDVIDAIIKQKNDKKFSLIYVTNNSKRLPDRVVDYLKTHLGINVKVVLSIDAVGMPFDYIRTNGRWDEFQDNFAYLRVLQSQGLQVSIHANITISVLNLLYLNELYDWWITNGQDINKITSAFVEGCEQYSFRILTNDQKKTVVNELETSQYNVSHIKQAVLSSAHDQSLLDEFWKDCSWTKSYHGMDIEEYLPRLVALLRSNG